VPPRWYTPPGDIRWDRLTPDPHRTLCQYKGQAHYWTIDGTDPPVFAWSYPEAMPEAAGLSGLVGIAGEDPAVDVLITEAPAQPPGP
jgi:acyl-CoA thioesterase II